MSNNNIIYPLSSGRILTTASSDDHMTHDEMNSLQLHLQPFYNFLCLVNERKLRVIRGKYHCKGYIPVYHSSN